MLSIVSFIWQNPKTAQYKIPTEQMGIKYNDTYANKMYSMLSRNLTIPFKFILFVDKASEPLVQNLSSEIELKPLWDTFSEMGGCYRRLYTFSSDMRELIGPRFACIDLDTVIVNNVDHIFSREEDFVYFKAPGPSGTGSRMNCGLYMMDAGAREFVWTKFIEDPQEAKKISQAKFAGSDQAWCNYILDLDKEAYWDISDGHYNVRQHFLEKGRTELPKDAAMIHWPGPRDPNETKWGKYTWLKTHYK